MDGIPAITLIKRAMDASVCVSVEILAGDATGAIAAEDGCGG